MPEVPYFHICWNGILTVMSKGTSPSSSAPPSETKPETAYGRYGSMLQKHKREDEGSPLPVPLFFLFEQRAAEGTSRCRVAAAQPPALLKRTPSCTTPAAQTVA
jgi:hypothetical protein